ncbi:TPA: hypothetical protein SI312_000093 [Escherichia coli]|uniref:hypothetical protein n=1 Tax=Escherichia coli TaxID=562 RepID=UPI0029BC82B8|nr:hypothetical protein [Escherichia coli]
MTKEEKVLFLFTQTCSVLGKQASNPNSHIATIKERFMGIDGQINANFDSVYSVLEQKLDEKLRSLID